MTDPYAPHSDFIRPAKRVTDPRDVATVFATFAAAFFAIPVLIMMILPDAAQIVFYEGSTPIGALAQFGVFGLPALVFVRALKRTHGRGFWSLIGPYRAAWFDLRNVAAAVGLALIVMQFIVPWGASEETVEVRSLVRWLMVLPFAIAVILIQVTTEEIVFRGYLQQQLACLSSSRWVWMMIPSLMFGAWHLWNGNSLAEGVVYAVWATLLGMACADLTARTGTLGAAIGLHFATNFMAVMFVATDGWPFSGLALVVYPYQDPDQLSAEIAEVMVIWMIYSVLIMALSVLVMWLAARNWIKR
jgi:membrane protease YdiL (CAAX protease family)